MATPTTVSKQMTPTGRADLSPSAPDDPNRMDLSLDPDFDPSLMSPVALSTSAHYQSEISMVEKLQDVGVTFSPQLSAQRQQWALEVLSKEGVTSVLDIGCGSGDLLRALCQPAATVPEPPIMERGPDKEVDVPYANGDHLHHHRSRKRSSRSSPPRSSSRSRSKPRYGHRGRAASQSESEDDDMFAAKPALITSTSPHRPKELRELFLHRVGGLDVDPAVIPKAVAATAPPPETPGVDDSMQMDTMQAYIPPRWQRLEVEIWQGGLERHNHRLEGFEAIVATEVIEHLDAPSMDVFPQMIFGTLRPRLVLITTPNFEFNAKFPRAAEHDHDHPHVKKGFLDPSQRTDRVFRHSDHKFEMTENEFADWCDGAEEWGYSCEISGVGISSQPSYHDNDPNRPLYATQTAIFRLESTPTRSPRSVRTAALPFMPGGGEALHPHRLAARHIHEPRGVGAMVRKGLRAQSNQTIRDIVSSILDRWKTGTVSLQELWGVEDVSAACAGSKRTLVAALGGWGSVPGEAQQQLEVFWPNDPLGTLSVRWLQFTPQENGATEAKAINEVEMANPTEW